MTYSHGTQMGLISSLHQRPGSPLYFVTCSRFGSCVWALPLTMLLSTLSRAVPGPREHNFLEVPTGPGGKFLHSFRLIAGCP